MLENRTYNPQDIYMHNDRIKRAIDALKDHSLAETEEEHEMFTNLYHSLLEGNNGSPPDRYFVLNDLPGFYEAQKKVEELYVEPNKWAEFAIHNMAGMGTFSTDESIHNYARLAWEVEPCPLDKEELNRVREEYSEHDKCRVRPEIDKTG